MAQPKTRLAGYAALLDSYNLEAIPNWHRSLVASTGTHRIRDEDGLKEETYPAKYWPGNSPGGQLEFALKYDGTNLAILATLFEVMPEEDLLEYIRSKPTGKYARRAWFLFEFLTGRSLPLEDVQQGNYVDLLDADRYYTVSNPKQVRRQRINDNSLGNRSFCPTVRRTGALAEFEAADLPARCRKVVEPYPPELLKRALNYLYSRETKSSFEIEKDRPSPSRTDRFVALLQSAETEDYCNNSHLVELQNRIVDRRFAEGQYRDTQNYVGESVSWQNEKVHFAGPQPGDLPSMMKGFIEAHQHLEDSQAPAVLHAATMAFGFAFLHPFEDGNGRIHRFLIHNILARRGFTPKGIMFPVSACMLKHPLDYNASLEAFSQPLMAQVQYSLDKHGQMTVQGDTARWYRYMDLTPQVEALYSFIEQTIDQELAQELAFLANYSEAKESIKEIVDMPDRKVDLLIRFCLQNNGQLSAKKRHQHFEQLSDQEIGSLVQVIQEIYEN